MASRAPRHLAGALESHPDMHRCPEQLFGGDESRLRVEVEESQRPGGVAGTQTRAQGPKEASGGAASPRVGTDPSEPAAGCWPHNDSGRLPLCDFTLWSRAREGPAYTPTAARGAETRRPRSALSGAPQTAAPAPRARSIRSARGVKRGSPREPFAGRAPWLA